MRFEIRSFASDADYEACFRLQKETWGEGFVDVVPPAIQKVAQKIGGVAAGAFDEAGRLVAFVFGMTGVKNGRIVHWSDMLAVRPEARDAGLGEKLKRRQREICLAIGCDEMLWTCDPLVARNAHLNFTKLGADIADYVVDMYGAAGETSALARGIGTDRFLVSWRLADPATVALLEGKKRFDPAAYATAPIVNTRLGPKGPQPIAPTLPLTGPIRIEIPEWIHDPAILADGARWRSSTRAAFQAALASGRRLRGFHRDSAHRCFYTLT